MPRTLPALLLATGLLLAAGASPAAAVPEGPEYPSPAWFAREQQNFALTSESPSEQLSDPAFVARFQEQSQANFQAFLERQVTDPEFREEPNLCATWGGPCTGDPYAYPGVDPFYDSAVVEPVEFVDRGGARLSGRVWAPADATAGSALPGVVIMNGSVQAPETAYWTIAQALVRDGYEVLTFDPRSAGRSDATTPDGVPGSNANPQAFPDNLVDAIDFFSSTPDEPYPYAATPAGTPFNPLHGALDPERLGIVGHSLGAIAVTIVQGYSDADWPGKLHDANPVDVVVALDNLALTSDNSDQTADAGAGPLSDGVALDAFGAFGTLGDQVDAVVPRVPAMGQSGDYFLAPTPMTAPPDPEGKKEGYARWRDAGVPTAQVQIRGGTHYEFSRLPTFPNRSWSIGSTMSTEYSVAWLDRWMKTKGEPGFADADARLLADDTYRPEMSVYYRNARAFPDRSGTFQLCEDIRAGCNKAAPTASPTSGAATQPPDGTGDTSTNAAPARSFGTSSGTRSLAATGLPAAAPLLGLALLGPLLLRRRRDRLIRTGTWSRRARSVRGTGTTAGGGVSRDEPGPRTHPPPGGGGRRDDAPGRLT